MKDVKSLHQELKEGMSQLQSRLSHLEKENKDLKERQKILENIQVDDILNQPGVMDGMDEVKGAGHEEAGHEKKQPSLPEAVGDIGGGEVGGVNAPDVAMVKGGGKKDHTPLKHPLDDRDAAPQHQDSKVPNQQQGQAAAAAVEGDERNGNVQWPPLAAQDVDGGVAGAEEDKNVHRRDEEAVKQDYLAAEQNVNQTLLYGKDGEHMKSNKRDLKYSLPAA